VQLFWGNLISPVPLNATGMDELDSFLRWQKTFMRVTSARPDWQYDEIQKVLMIHNPMDYYYAGITCYTNYTETQFLNQFGANWVKEYAFQLCRQAYGELLMKYSGAVPGPVKDIQLDQGKRDKAEVKIKELEDTIKGAQNFAPISID